MTNQDFPAFMAEFTRMSSALERYKRTESETAAKADAYFHVLKVFPMSVVVQKADTWLASESKFPTPAQWASVIVTHRVELPTMSDAEARDYIRAEELRYEDAPCHCPACREADVMEKPLRFVPVEPEQRKRLGDRVAVVGRWIHGLDLFRWYRARADYYNAMAEKGFLKGM